jgi:arginine exporter protein ArgO
MSAFWEGILAGYGIAIPVGAIAVLIIDVGLRRGFRAGFWAGAGAATADFLYAALAAAAGEIAAAALAPYATPLHVASAFVLCALGLMGLWRVRSRARGGALPAAGDARVDLPALAWRTYAQFLGLTLLNPLTVVYFGALILGRGAASANTTAARLAFVVGAGAASLSWQTLLAGLGALGQRRLSPRVQIIVGVIGNVVIVALGLRILFQ